ncbi:MAG: hypothetical protein ABH969_10450, partial [Pseudomonadota bacterium]
WLCRPMKYHHSGGNSVNPCLSGKSPGNFYFSYKIYDINIDNSMVRGNYASGNDAEIMAMKEVGLIKNIQRERIVRGEKGKI